MKKTILAGAIAAMMLASAATSAVTFAQDNNAKIVTVTSAAKASGKNSVVKLSRLSDLHCCISPIRTVKRRSLCSRAYKEPCYKRQTSDGQR